MASSPPPFQLSSSLHAHQADVRSVSSPSPSVVLSSSRDKSAIAWIRSPSSPNEWSIGKRWEDLGGFVGAVWGGIVDGESYVVTGSQDSMVSAYLVPNAQGMSPSEFNDVTSNEPSHIGVGHTANVCCLDGLAGGDGIVSGSWDTTAIVWSPSFQPLQTLKAHQQTVWSVKSISSTQLLTGSADKTIVLWNKEADGKWKEGRRFVGHTDAVRSIAIPPGSGSETFASCGNDASIIVWSLTGDQLISLHGHTSFIYSLTFIPSSPSSSNDEPHLASVSEDRTLRIWNEVGKNIQTIAIPATSVWSVAATAEGDVVTGSSDGTVRVWTRDVGRAANEGERKALEEEVGKQKVDQNSIGDLKKQNVPGMEALDKPGSKEGQVITVKNASNVVEAHQWSTATSSWTKIGEVVDAVGSNRKQLFNGIEYDYVFDVDITEGAPPLKLPYNASENPYMAAKTFLEKNDLPQVYLDEVVAFINKNTEGVTLGAEDSATYVDPYTGASRYQSNSSSVPTSGSGGAGASYTDPWSGRTLNAGPSSLGAPSSSSAAPPSNRKSKPSGILPVETYLSFKTANLPALGKKLFELDGEMAEGVRMGEGEEKEGVQRLVSFLEGGGKGESRVREADLKVLLRVVERWEAGKKFPLLDLIRLLLPTSSHFASSPSSILPPTTTTSSIISFLLSPSAANFSSSSSSPWDKPKETNAMLVFRGLANWFDRADGRGVLGGKEGEGLLQGVMSVVNGEGWSAMGKNVRVAIATVVLNYSILLLQSSSSSDALPGLLLDVILTIFQSETSDSETVYRTTVAFGNLILSPKASGSLQVGRVQEAKQACLDGIKKSFSGAGNERLGELGREVGGLGV